MNKVMQLLHKVFMTDPNDKEGMQPGEALSYSLCGFGQNLISAIVSSYLTYYLTDGLMIASTAVGFIMLGTRLYDALNDPIMGTIVDHTHSKWGKSRPYVLFASFPIAILTIMCFLPYNLWGMPFGDAVDGWKTVTIVTVFYVLWSMAYTAVDVPYWSLATSMTSNTNQRGVMLTIARLLCTAGSGVVSIVVPPLADVITKDYYVINETTGAKEYIGDYTAYDVAEALQKYYVIIVLVIVIISLPFFYIGFKNSKERFYDPAQTLTLKENLNLLFKNKPLVLVVIAGILGGGKTLYLYSTMYISQYCFNTTAWATLFTMAAVPGGLVASVLVPWCTKKWGKRNTYIVSHIVGGAVLIGAYFLCRYVKGGNIANNTVLAIYVIALIFAGIPQGFANIITYAQIADCIEYMEWKTGKRGEGICFAMQTFINKIGIALGAAFTCFGLALAGIDTPEMWRQMQGTPEALSAQQFLIGVTLILPGASMILSAIPYFFYHFNEEDQERAVREIAERKAAAMAAEGADGGSVDVGNIDVGSSDAPTEA